VAGFHLSQGSPPELHGLQAGTEGLGEETLDQPFQATLEFMENAQR
jgi:hypothetical protein